MKKKKVSTLKERIEQLEIDVARIEHGLNAAVISFIDVAKKAELALELARKRSKRR